MTYVNKVIKLFKKDGFWYAEIEICIPWFTYFGHVIEREVCNAKETKNTAKEMCAYRYSC